MEKPREVQTVNMECDANAGLAEIKGNAMPTAVELIAQKIFSQIKFDGVEGESLYVSSIVGSLDGTLAAFNTASTPAQFAAADGSVFKHIGALASGFGDVLIQGWSFGATQTGGWNVAAQDAKTAGADLKTFGADIARLADARTHDAVLSVENVFHPDLQHLSRDFAALGADMAKLGGPWQPVADEFAHMSADFAAIDRAFGLGAGAGQAFASLAADVHAFDVSIQQLAGSTTTLLPAVQRI